MLNPREEAVLQLISEDLAYENYFFNKVSNLKWFYPLKEKYYFSPEKAPQPIQTKESGHFAIPFWIILPYLEKVSQQVTIEGNGKYAEELLDIINDVTKYHIEHERKLDDYHTWWYFVKILINIPNDRIVKYLKEHKINIGQDWIKEWLTSRFDNMLPASDISTKLLPKFLADNKDDIEIVEQIIKVITDIDWRYAPDVVAIADKIRGREKRKVPHLLVNSHWLIETFKKNAKKIGDLCSDKVIYDLADKLKDIFNREHSEYQVLIDLNDNTYRIQAKRVEKSDSRYKDFDFNVSIEVLHKDEIEALKPEDRYFGILNVKGDILYAFSINNIRSIGTFVQVVKNYISQNTNTVLLIDYIEIDKKIGNLYNGLYSDYSSIWYKSFYSGPDVGIHYANELLTFVLRDVLLAKCQHDSEIGKKILDRFLSDEYQYPLFRRFVLYIAGMEWNEYGEVFRRFLEDNPEVFNESDYEVELHKLLQTNINKFTENEKQKIETLICRGPRYIPEQGQEHYIAYWKQKWYSAMLKDPYFARLFEKQKAITGIEKIEPPAEETGFVCIGEGPSPLSKEDILKMSNREIIKYLNEFKPKDKWEGPTKRGLAEVLKAAVKENPDKFIEDLEPFLNVGYLYACDILSGVEDAWKEKKNFDWRKLFDFAKKYINKPTFWEEAKNVQAEDWARGTHTWVINVISDLIQEGTRDDSWAFAEDYFTQAEEIMDIMIEKLPVEQEEPSRDAVSYALNTSYGRVTIALIYLSLRRARVEEKQGIKKEIKWKPTKYENLLNKGVIAAFTLFGQYMSNLTYLNKPWVKEKIKEFDEKISHNDIKWQSFIQGYLFGGRVYRDLYDLMRNHYLKAIDSDFKEGHAEERLVQHIAIGYLRGYESLYGKESLFKKIIDKWKYSQLTKIVSFFWLQGDRLTRQTKEENVQENKKIKDRIIEFWCWTYEKKDILKEKLKDDYKKLLSDLARLTILLDKINSENSRWLLLSAPYVDIEHNAHFFIEYLNKFEDKESIGYICKIFLEMLLTITPAYDQNHIISLVEKIYNRDKTEADKICNIYGSRGYEFLRQIYEEHNE